MRRAAIVFALFIIAVALALVALVLRSRAFLERQAERDRANGVPVTFAELNAYYHDNDEADRMGELLSDVFTNDYDTTYEYVGEVHYAQRFVKLNEEISPASVDHLRAHVEANRDYFTNLHPLVETFREVRFPVDKSEGWDAPHPHWAQVRNALRMQSCQMYLAISDGDISQAVVAISDGIVLSETLRSESTLIPQLVRNICHAISRDQIEYALNRAVVSPVDISRIVLFASRVELEGFVQDAMIGEKCFAYIPESPQNSPRPEGDGVVSLILNVAQSGLLDVWRANSVSTHNRIYEIGNLAPWKRRDAAEDLIRSVERRTWVTNLFAKISVSSEVNAYEAENRGVAGRDTMLLALDVLRFTAEQGRLPESLEQMLPEYIDAIPIDPFDGQPLRYRRTGTAGFVVYSVGHDRDDDGGTAPPAGESILEDGDVVFRILDATGYLVQVDRD